MGARSGNNYLSSLRRLKSEIWLDGGRVADPVIHPAFVHQARVIASLYDLQMEHPAAMTYRLDDGDRVGMSFIQPATLDEVRKRGTMFWRWAEVHGGRLTFTPDYFNTGLAAMAAAANFFAAEEPRFGENLERYYAEARHFDWCATHTLEDSFAPREPGANEDRDEPHPTGLLKLVEKTIDGIVVDGARKVAPTAPLSEELLVLPPSFGSDDLTTAPHAMAFAIKCNVAGLKFVCRSDPVRGAVPLGPQMDCVAIFDHVSVPPERIFLCGDVARARATLEQTNAIVNQTHQRAVGYVVAAELRTGLVASIAERRGAMGFPNVRERLGQMIAATGLIRSCLHAAEAGAHRDQWGQFVPARLPLDAACAVFERLYHAS